MGDFVSQDWGLEAIVNDDHSAAMFDPFVIYQQNHINMRDDFVINLFDANTSTLSSEFDQIYNPFYPVVDDSLSQHLDSFSEQMNIIKPAEEMRQQKSSKSTTNTHAVLKYKKRKNQHKRVVLQPEGQPSDNWAWRKYGQKPIKGSPYPRSYYKCSSSKGCLARKQVEESYSDPGMFRITYSAEHNHSEPTRRSSLAGKNHHKFTLQNTSSSSNDDTSFGTSGASPLTPTSIIEEMILAQHIKNEENIDGTKNECIFSDDQDMLLNDDFFVGLENLDGLISDSAFYNLLHTY